MANKKKTAPKPKAKQQRKSTTPAKLKGVELAESLRRTSQIKGKSPIALSQRSQQRLEAIRQQEAQRDETLRRWLLDLKATRKTLKAAREKYRESVRDALSVVYEKYIEIRSSEFREEFFKHLRGVLIEMGVNIQKNTPDAGLVVRLVWGADISNAQIHKYVSVMNYALDSEVTTKDFKPWLEKLTITGAVEASKIGVDRDVLRKQELERARIVILRYLEQRETKPFASLKMLAASAERKLSVNTNLCLMLGTAVRRMDRESDYGDILISAILPPNLGLDVKIIDRWARFISSRIEEFEREIDEMDEARWCDKVEETIWAAEQADAEEKSVYWSQRQQAALHEDQQEFNAKNKRKTKRKAVT